MIKKMVFSLGILLTVISLSGCSTSSDKTMTCTKSETDEDGYKTEDTIKINYNKDNYVTKVSSTSTLETDESYVDMTIGFLKEFETKFNEIGGINYSISKEGNNKIKLVLGIDYEKLDVDKLKEAAGDGLDLSLVDSNDTHVTIEEFKKNELEGYICK